MNEQLPTALEQLWRLREEREPRVGLSVARVVAAAIELADADGLAAVSMGRVAERLGYTTMSLYRHVQSKEDLLVLMADAAVGEPPAVLDAFPDGWRAGIEAWARELLTVMRRHPWVMEILITGPPLRPTQLSWLDRGLRALADTGLAEDEKASVILTVNGSVFWQAKLDADLERAAQDEEMAIAYGTVLSTLIDEERFPALHRAVESGIFDEPGDDREGEFEFALARVLDGVERLVATRAP